MGVSKVMFSGETVVDLTSDTVTADNLAEGITAHGADGEPITGTMKAGLDTSDADATETDIAKEKTAYVNGEKVTGTLPSYGSSIVFGKVKYVEGTGTPKIDTIQIYGTNTTDHICRKDSNIRASATITSSNWGDAEAEDVVAGKTFTSVAGYKVTGTHTCAAGGGLTMKSGTTTSGTIETGLSSIQCIVIYKSSVSATGLVQAVWLADDGSANYVYCSSYSIYFKNYAVGTNTASTVSGGTFTWGGSGTSGLSSNTTYNWIAFGEA